jgi:hypothetical protein
LSGAFSAMKNDKRKTVNGKSNYPQLPIPLVFLERLSIILDYGSLVSLITCLLVLQLFRLFE